jgi:4-hydroxybutyrate CoA-transferase
MLANRNWRDKFRKKIVSGEDAARKIKSGMSIQDIHMDEAFAVIHPLTKRVDLENVTIYVGIMPPDSPFAEPEKLKGRFNIFSLFLNRASSPLVDKSLVSYIPSHNSRCSKIFTDHDVKLDAIILNVTSPDRHGFLSTSYGSILYKPTVHQLKKEQGKDLLVIACINENLPFCCGDTLIHESEVDLMVEDHRPMKPYPWYSEEQLGGELPQIAANVASLVDDGATLECGIGRVPPHVCRALGEKNDLGIHTEVMSGPIFELVEKGVVTGRYKNFNPYQVVYSFALPDRMEMFDWFDRNPACAAYPLSYVCDPELASKNHKFTAVNSALQVDLTGQVNSEVRFNSQWSGTGGHADFSRAAYMCEGGKSIVAIPSTSNDGTISRITGGPLYPGGVTTARTDIQYVVTEYGIAKIMGSSLKATAHALIEIAHPKFRGQLEDQAKEQHLW